MKKYDLYGLNLMATNFDPLPTGNDFLDSRYEWQRTSNGAEWPYYRFFYHLAKLLQPALTVELGGYQGTAAAHCAAGWPSGDVVTIDHHTDPGDEVNQAKMLQACAEFGNIVYLQGWTNSEAAAREYGQHGLGTVGSVYTDIVKLTVDQGRRIDILFIDSWHTYENAILDWQSYKPFMASPALVICDDIQDGGDEFSPISGMLRFWNEMPEPKFLNANLHPGTNMGFVRI